MSNVFLEISIPRTGEAFIVICFTNLVNAGSKPKIPFSEKQNG